MSINITGSATNGIVIPSAPLPEGHPISDDDLDILQTAIPDKAKALSPDTLAFWRELPGLLSNGEEGRCALVHDGRVVSLWDSVSDAAQAGYDQFGPEALFLTPVVKRLELQRMGQFLLRCRAESQLRNQKE